mmetsp:Transcript_30148/g.45613  ORF Transcript_30148/g.45613 Transcript_30148/m.45613 type:complete len:81 (-) Transcript_30148:739-981(-)
MSPPVLTRRRNSSNMPVALPCGMLPAIILACLVRISSKGAVAKLLMILAVLPATSGMYALLASTSELDECIACNRIDISS